MGIEEIRKVGVEERETEDGHSMTGFDGVGRAGARGMGRVGTRGPAARRLGWAGGGSSRNQRAGKEEGSGSRGRSGSGPEMELAE